MSKKIITRISNEIGNQLFMYASTFAIAKKLNRELLIDNESSFKSLKNISNYGLNNFNLTSNIANDNDKFLGIYGYIKRKILKKINFFLRFKNFYIEKKDKKKLTKYHDDILKINFSNKVYFEGYFETEKYFLDIKNQILNEFNFKHLQKYKESENYQKINQNNTISICLRQNRFIEGKDNNTLNNRTKSDIFRNEQINYINKSMIYLKNIVENPTFYLWSNDLENIDMSLFNTKVHKIYHDSKFTSDIDKRALDLFLISQCNHHIVIPSSFNWWGAWLCQKNNKIICRPNDNFFSSFRVNNEDFWPKNWVKIS